MSKKDLIYEKITALFADDSMPPMILLDGKWGCGKSYYVTNTLIPKLNQEYKNSKVLYFSLYGISDLGDFRDKLISAYYLKDSQTAGLLASVTKPAIEILQHFDNEKGGLASTILSGFNGIAKHSLLSKLSDFILILDDLERVSGDGLCEKILAECLEFSASQTRKVKVITVGNAQRIPDLKLFLNKVFIDQVIFSRSVDDLFNVAFKKLEFDTFVANGIKKLITDLNLKNLRILKRAANKLAPLMKEINQTAAIDVPMVSSLIAHQIITLCHVHYELNESYEAIRSSLANYSYMELPDDEGPFDEKKESANTTESHRILSSIYNVPNTLVLYACGEVFTATLDDCGLLPMKSRALDKLFYNFLGRLSSEDFEQGYKDLLQFIQQKEDVACKQWFFCIDFLDNLIKNRYVLPPEFIGNSPLDYAKNTWTDINFMNAEPDFNRGRFTNKDINALLSDVLIFINKKQQDEAFKNLTLNMLDSWSNVDMVIYEEWESKTFFNLLPNGLLEKCLIKWEPKDVSLFTDFLKTRYRSEPIANSYIGDMDFWNKFTDQIKELVLDYPPSLKVGSLTELLVVVEAITGKRDTSRLGN